MTTRSFASVILFLSAFVATGSSVAFAGRDALVGKWSATVTPDDMAPGKEYTDTVTFKGSKFTSDTLAKDGFEPTTYNDNPSPFGVAAKFDVTLTNKAGDTAVWTGESLAQELTGTLVVTKKDGAKISYSFKATKK